VEGELVTCMPVGQQRHCVLVQAKSDQGLKAGTYKTVILWIQCPYHARADNV